MNLLFAVDDLGARQMLTTIYSIVENTSLEKEKLIVYVLQKQKLQQTALIEGLSAKLGFVYRPVLIDEKLFASAPTTDRYPTTIYYRLLAQEYLPNDLDKILYLDNDLLCINDLKPLYELDLKDYLYAACSHTRLEMVDVLNNVRLGPESGANYYNSGVLLMNLPQIRAEVKAQAIFQYLKENQNNLFLPDQDILNGLYGQKILSLPDEYDNYDARKPTIYEAISFGRYDLDWVIKNTRLLHFCGRDKPWKKAYNGRFAGLYKHYHKKCQDLLGR